LKEALLPSFWNSTNALSSRSAMEISLGCIVDVGFEKDAFLHYLDLGPQFHSYQKYLKQVLSDKKHFFLLFGIPPTPYLPGAQWKFLWVVRLLLVRLSLASKDIYIISKKINN